MFPIARQTFRRTMLALAAAAAIVTPALAGATDATPAAGPASAVNKSTPAFDALRAAWAGVTNYSETIVAHETSNDGRDVQDRTYAYEFVKPDHALITIVGGPGRGGAVAWNGGSTVRGHKGGFLAGIKLTLAKNDPKVVSLRGDAVDDASFGHEIDRYATIPGTLSDGKSAGGSTTITFVPKTTEPSGVTREMLTIGSDGLPSKREQFVGERAVKIETFANIKINDPKLSAADIAI